MLIAIGTRKFISERMVQKREGITAPVNNAYFNLKKSFAAFTPLL